LAMRFEKKLEPNYPRQLQVAVRKPDVLIRGKFLRQAGTKAFQFWQWNQNVENFSDIAITIFEQELNKLPREPLDLTCIRDFNKAFDRLQRDVFNKSQWIEFSEFCKKASQDLQDYKAIDPKNRNLGQTFAIEEKKAQAVLNVWTDVIYLKMRFSGSSP